MVGQSAARPWHSRQLEHQPPHQRLDPVHITHPKPGEVAAVVAQIRAIDTAHRIEPLVRGVVFELA